ncbi:allantoicase [Streptacidiphilus sp. ASG 303]|uniref:allantoicase n=1 Tax=Streptacidiphilus sp. ASG 303 TaxID=2896847 RepID=UPI001E2F98F2|nr:allantoicase [Streptacidiphilus sp. ASG 303]MCD0481452.1 allantoicase [Streptacidiphilus sp. ASG 303]
MSPAETPFTDLLDLASRALGAGVVAASDESFAEKENLLAPAPPVFRPRTFGNKGQVMDGWETRRRRGARPDRPHPAAGDHDWALVRLGAPGVVRGVVVDTAHFNGNHPVSARVEAASVPGHPAPEDLLADGVEWTVLVPDSPLEGDTAHAFPVAVGGRFTHVRLVIAPDGGVARLRVHGEAVPDPRDLDGLTFDLAAQEHGGVALAASDRHYSSPHHLNAPGRAAVMGEGWETRRRRDDGHDWVELSLAGRGEVLAVEIDTTHFVFNAPGWAALLGRDDTAPAGPGGPEGGWTELLPRTRLQPDTRHRFRLDGAPPATRVRLAVYPDGGMARLRLTGRLTPEGRTAMALRWYDTLPAPEAERALADAGLTPAEAAALTAARPLRDAAGARAAAAALPPTSGGADADRRREALRALLGV